MILSTETTQYFTTDADHGNLPGNLAGITTTLTIAQFKDSDPDYRRSAAFVVNSSVFLNWGFFWRPTFNESDPLTGQARQGVAEQTQAQKDATLVHEQLHVYFPAFGDSELAAKLGIPVGPGQTASTAIQSWVEKDCGANP